MKDKLIASVIQTNVHLINFELKRLIVFMPDGSLFENPRTGETNSVEFTGIVRSLCDLICLVKALQSGDSLDDTDNRYIVPEVDWSQTPATGEYHHG